MSQTGVVERERRLLTKVAADYERRGYKVTVRPPHEMLPDFLVGFQPDLLARSATENLVIEVRARGQIGPLQELSALERVLQDQTGWQFELFIDGEKAQQRDTLGTDQVAALLREAEQLSAHSHRTAAFLLAWSAVEGSLRLVAEREQVELEAHAPVQIVQELYSMGLLSRAQYETLAAHLDLRNALVHGFQVPETEVASAFPALLTVAHELLDNPA